MHFDPTYLFFIYKIGHTHHTFVYRNYKYTEHISEDKNVFQTEGKLKILNKGSQICIIKWIL